MIKSIESFLVQRMAFAVCTVRLLKTMLLLLALWLPMIAAGEYDGWSQGRATFYGEDGGTTIDQGSCMFGHIDANKGTGLNVVALADSNSDYKGSCGRCYEVACRPAHIRDGYGQDMDRTNSCKSGSTIVRVTDTCPCHYPSNQYSNSRWCCGDQYHMDLSKWAFEKIGSTGDGAIGIYYRQVTCPGGKDDNPSAPCDHLHSCHETSSSYGGSSSGSWPSPSPSPASPSSSSSFDGASGSSGSSSSASASDSSSSSSSSWSSSSSSSSGDQESLSWDSSWSGGRKLHHL